MTKTDRKLAEALDRIKRLERKCLELQHENAEHRSMYKQMFRTLQEAQKWQTCCPKSTKS